MDYRFLIIFPAPNYAIVSLHILHHLVWVFSVMQLIIGEFIKGISLIIFRNMWGYVFEQQSKLLFIVMVPFPFPNLSSHHQPHVRWPLRLNEHSSIELSVSPETSSSCTTSETPPSRAHLDLGLSSSINFWFFSLIQQSFWPRLSITFVPSLMW